MWHSGDLSDLPFPFLLFRIWEDRLSGSLNIKTDPVFSLDFKNGEICISSERSNDQDWMTRLKEKAALKTKLPQKIKNLPELLETAASSPEEAWINLNSLAISETYPLFNLAKASYVFHSEHCWEEHEILFYIPTLDLILEGIRRMTDTTLFEAHLPAADKTIKPLLPEYLKEVSLNAPEIYLYHVVKKLYVVEDIYSYSRLGKTETQRALYAFLALGLVGLPRTSIPKTQNADISQAEIYHLMEEFNHLFAFIYKYISKEIGPASMNVLEKCLDDTKNSLSSLFQNLRFDLNGRIEISSIPITSATAQGRRLQQVLLQDLNEILAAEILAVKRLLGNAHEAALIKNLEKINACN